MKAADPISIVQNNLFGIENVVFLNLAGIDPPVFDEPDSHSHSGKMAVLYQYPEKGLSVYLHS